MTVESTLRRVNAEIAEGRLWRGKEILSSSLSTYGYSREIFFEYAILLMKMGDEFEAGKYFLLSVDDPDSTQERVMTLFLQRFQHDTWQQLLSRFPRSACIDSREGYPMFLRNQLVRLQMPEAFLKEPETAKPVGRYMRLLPIGCIVVVTAIAICSKVGGYTILKWLID